MIPRNSALPTSRTDLFFTLKPGQPMIQFEVTQGEEIYSDDNLSLGKLNIKVPYNRKDLECCEVTYYYDINAILIVHVKVLSTGKEHKLVLTGDGLTPSDKEMEKHIAKISNMKLAHIEHADMLMERAKAIHAQGDATIKQYIQQLVPELGNMAIGSMRVRKEQLSGIESILDEIEKSLNRSDVFNNMADKIIDIAQYLAEHPPKG